MSRSPKEKARQVALYAAELYTADGTRMEQTAPSLTPERVLGRSLEAHLPGIFQFDIRASGGADLSGVGLVLPLIAAGKLQACVSLLWRTGADFAAALEIWRPDASGVLRLGDSFYGSLQTFEQVSRAMAFRVLEGLPGITFDAHQPVIFETLSKMRGFLRAEAAAAAGLCVGLGIPVLDKGTATCAALLLSSRQTPLARTFEVWLPHERSAQLASIQSLGLESMSGEPSVNLATAAIRSRLPQLDSGDQSLRIALPIFSGRAVQSVVVLRN